MAKGGVIGNLRVNLGLDSAQFQVGLASASKSMDAMAQKAAAFGTKVGLAITAAAAGIGAFVKVTASAAASTGDVADRLGVAAESLQELRHAAEMSGVGVQNFDMAFRRFIRRSSEAARGTGAAKDAFKELGVRLTDTNGRMRASENIFNDVADAMAKVNDPANRLRLAFKIFDTDGAAMTKMLASGSEGIKKFREQAQQLGIVMDEKTIQAAGRFNDTLSLIGKSAEGFRTRIFAGVIPSFEALAVRLFEASSNTRLVDTAIRAITLTMDGLTRALTFVADNFDYVVKAAKLFITVQVASVAIGMGRALIGLAYSLRSVGLVMTAVHAISRVKLKTWLLMAGAIAIVTGQFEKLESTLSGIWDRVKGFLPDAIMGSLVEDLSAGIPKAEEILDGLGNVISNVDKEAQKLKEAFQRITDSAKEFIEGQELEARLLGMTEQAANALRYEFDLLNDARRAGIDLSPVQEAALRGLATSMAAAEAATKKLRDSFDFAKDTTKGFFTDMMQGIRNGEGVWKSFANAAVNALQKISDKLLDMALDQMINGFLGNLLGGMGGGFKLPMSAPIPIPRPSFEGGGFTGYGVRSGGVDGRGGFPAILHPNETVIDHTRRAGNENHTNQNVRVEVEVFVNDDGTIGAIARQAGQQAAVSVVQANNKARQKHYQNGGQHG